MKPITTISITFIMLASLSLAPPTTAKDTAVKHYSVEDFFTHPTYSSVIISPSGNYLAIKSTDGTSDSIFIYDRKKNEVLSKFSFGTYQRFSNIRWASDERIIFTGRKFVGFLDDRGSPPSLYATNIDGSNRRELIRWKESGWRLLSILPDDKDHVLIGKLYYQEEGMFAHKLNIHNGRTFFLADQPNKPGELVADNSGTLRASFAYEETENDAYGEGTFFLHYKPYQSNDWKKFHIDAFDNGNSLGFWGFSSDNRYAYVRATLDGANTEGLYRFDTATEEFTHLYTNEVSDLSILLYDLSGAPVAIEAIPGKYERYYLTESPRTRLLKELEASFPGERVYILNTTSDGKLAILAVRSAQNPGQFYLFNTESLEATYIASPYPNLQAEDMGSVEPIQLEARDGLTLHGYLTLPKGYQRERDGPLPTIVNVHGGPYGTRDKWVFSSENQFFANRGYAVLQVNFRGSGGYGDAFQKAGYQQWGRAMQDDVTDATLWAIEEGYAAKDRLCIYGASYGGYAALMGVIREPDLYQCAVGYVGVYSLPGMKRWGDVPTQKHGLKYLDHVLGTNEQQLIENSPAPNVEKIKASLFIVHGSEDVRVPMQHYEVLTEALDQTGTPYQSMVREEGHGYRIEKNRFELYLNLEAFFAQHLHPER